MNLKKIFRKIKNIFKKKEILDYPYYEYGVIVRTKSAIENNIYDSFNKKILIFKNKKIIKEMDYTEEDVRNLINIRKIPVVEAKTTDKYDIEQENNFGEIIT